jgi:hypothetical protein
MLYYIILNGCTTLFFTYLTSKYFYEKRVEEQLDYLKLKIVNLENKLNQYEDVI